MFSDLAVDLYDKHVTCAYLQAEKHPIFVLEHKHIVRPPYSFMLFWDSTTVEMIMVIRARAIQSQPRSVTWNFSPSTM